MRHANFNPYEGSEDYIFISYAHKNAEEVGRLLDRMHDAGYRIWYDDGIAPGSEWPEYIAHHLNKAAVCLALVSPASIESANCRREITYALSKQKPFLGVFLERTELSPGMELQLSAQQCILRYNYRTEDEFYQKLIDSEILSSCRTILVAPAAPEPEDETQIRTDGPAPISDADMSAVEHMTTIAEEEADAPKKKAKKAKAGKSTEGKRKRKKWLLPAILAAIILLIAMPFLLPKATEVKFTEDKKTSLSTSYLDLKDMEITDQSIKQLNKLKKLTSLSFTNCTFTGDFASYKRFSGLRSLSLEHCDGITDLSFLQKIENVSDLTLIDVGLTDEITSLAELASLKKVDFSENADFTQIALLPLPQLTKLSIAKTGVKDISALSEATALNTFSASGCTLENAESLVSLTKLTTLDLSDTNVSSFSQPLASLAIADLNLEGSEFTSTEAFDNLTVLTYLNISDTAIQEAACIAKSKDSLAYFAARNCTLTDETLEDLSHCMKMKELDLSGISLKEYATYLGTMKTNSQIDLRLAQSMPELTYIRAEGCGLTSLDGLGSKKKLHTVLVAGNQITDISDIGSLDSGAILDLRKNQIKNVSFLPSVSYRMLLLNENPLDPATIPTGSGHNYTLLTLDYQSNLLASDIANTSVSYWYLVGVPADQQLKTQDQLGSYRTNFVTSEAIDSMLDTYGYDPYHWK
ncbi:MAG: TIR domain-containing protein [Lachnospiraceae bacterium]|nr:TIR domain-containing protein [Lachnospiraceae bacterium]